MPTNAQLIEEKVLEAIGAYEAGEFTSIRAAANAVGAPLQRVYRRLKGIPSEIEKGGHNKRLSEAQENALYTLIQRYDDLGLSLRPQMLTKMANRVLFRACDPNNLPNPLPHVSHDWTRRFLERHPEFIKKKRKPINIHRDVLEYDHYQDIIDYFRRFEKAKVTYGIHDPDIWNMDETGFSIGVGRAHLVITQK